MKKTRPVKVARSGVNDKSRLVGLSNLRSPNSIHSQSNNSVGVVAVGRKSGKNIDPNKPSKVGTGTSRPAPAMTSQMHTNITKRWAASSNGQELGSQRKKNN